MQDKADYIVAKVLEILDRDNDGRISAEELESAGLNALPNFDGAEGHHYDVESGELHLLENKLITLLTHLCS